MVGGPALRHKHRTREIKLTLNVTIPANTTATVLVPAKNAAAITESGKPLAKAPGVKFLRMEGDRAVLERWRRGVIRLPLAKTNCADEVRAFGLASCHRVATMRPKPPMNTTTATMEPRQRAAWEFCLVGTLRPPQIKIPILELIRCAPFIAVNAEV
ncbi:MAG: hypothetical protein NTY01_14765 [Verrucomicrobia bacterium]|nr:hypothetical protein [Verrucomicrobiota bacterium]